jgi:hypothetical protein
MNELTPLAKSVWRHYYGKLKKQTRGGKLGNQLDGYLPGDKNASKLGVLYRGTNHQEVEKLAQGRFKSSWTSPGIFRGSPDRKATWVASSPQYAATYAVTAAQSRIVALTPAVLKRRDKGVSARMGETTMTAPIRGGIGQKEVRGLLKGEAFSPQRWNTRGIKKWKPVPLGEIQKKQFSMHEFGSTGIKRLLRRKLGMLKRGIYIETPKGSPSLRLDPGSTMMMVSKNDRAPWRVARQKIDYKTNRASEQIFKKSGRKDGDPYFRPQEIFDGKEYAIEKRMKRGFSRIDRSVVAMNRRDATPIGYEGGIPLTGRVPRDRYIKKIRDEDLDRRDANLFRAGVSGAAAGALLGRGRMPLKARVAIGAGSGLAGVLGIRQVTKQRRDPYGERQRGDKKAESIPALAGLGAAGYGAYKILRKKFKMSDGRKVTELAEMSAAQWKKATARMPDDPRQKAAAKWLKKQGHNSYVNWGWTDGVHKTYSKNYKTEGDRLLIHEEDGKLNVRRAGDDKLVASFSSIEFAEKKRQMNPYVMAGLSGAASGAALGILPLLRRGVGFKTALRTAAGGAAAGGTIVGGGSLLGSAILGDPDKKEGAAFTKRAAVGGAIVGGTLGVAGGLVARRVPVVRKQVGKLAKEWRPAQWIKNSGPVKAAAIGGVAGGAYGAGTGADEGQQVDSIRNIRKDLKRMHGLSSRIKDFTFEMSKDWRDMRRESRSEAAKDVLSGSGVLAAGAGVGAGVGYAGWRAGKALNQVGAVADDARKATRGARVASARITRASRWIKRQLTTFPTFRKFRAFHASGQLVELEKPFHGYNKKRHAKSGGLNDSFRAKYNREHGSNLKRPVTKDPSKLKPGSKAAKRRASFCARMSGMQGPTSKDGKLTPKGAALKRWNCSAKQELIEMNDKTYRPGSTAEMRSMKMTPAIKEVLKKENSRGAMAQKLRTLMKVLPFEARYEFQTMAPMNPVYDERERLKQQLLVTGAVATPVAGVGYAGWRSLRKSAKAMQTEEARMKLGQQLRAERRASMSVGGKVNNARFGPKGPIAREPLPIRKSMQPDTLERNQATNKAMAMGKRYESEIKSRYRAGSKMKMVHSRGERKAMRATLAMLRTKYKFARKGAVHQFAIYARDEETGRAAGFYDYVQGRSLTRKNPVTGRVEAAPITTGAFISAARRKAEEYNRTRKRGMGLVRDVSEVSQGKKTKKREWEKSWFQNKLQTAAGAAALLGAGVVYRKGGLRSAPNWAKSFRRGTDATISRAQNLRATAEDRLGKIMGLSARLKNSVQMFDMYQDYYSAPGWDLRDARGNSARVFSPKARKRMRRSAEWYEKKEGQRNILGGLAVAGTVAGTAGGLLVGRRIWKPKAKVKIAENVLKGPWKKRA